MRNPVTYRVKRLSEQGKLAAKVRWENENHRHDMIAKIDPVRVGGRIVERLVRIVNEERVVERVFYEFDRPCDWQRKRRELFESITNTASSRKISVVLKFYR